MCIGESLSLPRCCRQLVPGRAQEAEAGNDVAPLLQRQPAGERLAQGRQVAEVRLEVDELQPCLNAIHVRVRGKGPEVQDGVAGERAGVAAAVLRRSSRHRHDRGGKTAVGGDGHLLRRPGATAAREGGDRQQASRGRPAQKSWFSPAKMAETESSAKMFMIVSASRRETVSTSTLRGRLIESIGTVSVTVSCVSSLSAIFSNASPGKRPCVAQA